MKEKTAVQKVLEIIELAREGEIDNDLRSIRHRVEQLLELEYQQHFSTFNESRLTHPMIGFKHETFETYFTDTYEQPK